MAGRLSDNQEEFEALRKAVYLSVNEHGKDAERLQHFCEDFMRDWREKRGRREADDSGLIRDVVRWTMNRYNRPSYKPKRSREERAATFLLTPEAFRLSEEDYGKSSVRNAARITGQSKSTVARHLVRQGIAPRRETAIRKLSKTGQRLVRILDATFDRTAAGILQLERLGTALWDDGEPRHVPATTQTSRKKKLAALLAEISSAGVGYSIVTIGDVCGVLRGRRFRSLPEANTWIAEAQRLGRYPAIKLPEPHRRAGTRLFLGRPSGYRCHVDYRHGSNGPLLSGRETRRDLPFRTPAARHDARPAVDRTRPPFLRWR